MDYSNIWLVLFSVSASSWLCSGGFCFSATRPWRDFCLLSLENYLILPPLVNTSGLDFHPLLLYSEFEREPAATWHQPPKHGTSSSMGCSGPCLLAVWPVCRAGERCVAWLICDSAKTHNASVCWHSVCARIFVFKTLLLVMKCSLSFPVFASSKTHTLHLHISAPISQRASHTTTAPLSFGHSHSVHGHQNMPLCDCSVTPRCVLLPRLIV